MRRSLTVAAAIAAALLTTTPASAITSGEPDAGAHPYVALMQTYDDHNVPLQVCTGSLLSPTVFLTAGHCVAEPHATHAEIFLQPAVLPDIDYLIALFFDPNFDGSCDYSPNFDGYPCFGAAGGTPHAHPDFCFDCAGGMQKTVVRDVAVVTLDSPVQLSRYAQLPAPRTVETLANRTPLDVVGYGVQDQVKLPGKFFGQPVPGHRWTGSGQRMRAQTELVTGSFSNSDEFVRFTVDDGGTCFGDSGGPDLLDDTVLAVNSFVTNANCQGVVYSQRVDVPDVRAWIAAFMR
jgi:secreted trypsin-like serine protease